MKWIRLFLLCLFVPSLLCSVPKDYFLKEYNKDVEAMSSEWKRHEELVQQFNRLPFGEKAQNIGLLHTAIGCCRSAIDYCDHIINHINQKPKDDRKRWEDQKKQAQQNKGAISQEINNLQILINNTLAFAQAISLYQESEKKANLANLQDQNCTRRLNNVEEVVFLLNGVVHLYEEALTLAQDALNLISPYSDEESKNVLRQSIEKYRVAIAKYKNEAARWPAAVEGQRTALKERLLTLQEDCRLFEEKGLKRSSYELQKQIVPVLEQLIESSSCDEFVEELQEVKNTILAFEVEAANQRLTEVVPLLSQEDFVKQEAERKKHFFTNHLLLSPDLFLQNLLQPLLQSRALPLDGFVAKKDGHFTLYADQFYRFLVQNNTPVSNLVIKIYAQGEIVGEEKIPLPQKDTLEWQKFLTKDGMIFIPETRLKIKFGLDLRLQFAYDSAHTFSVIIAQKNNFLCNYQFLLSLDEEPLYIFNLAMPPPWQLDILRKPLQANSDRPLQKTLTPHHISLNENGQQEALSEANTYPLLDQFIQELKKDPLALASYVYNEIALVDPFVHQEEGVFYPPSIHRNALRTYLEKKGSPWEQCQLLAYLLRKAGYPTFYAIGGVSLLPKAFIEKLLLVKLGKNQREALISYPWVVFFDGKEWIPLFPWMKEIQVKEGYDLYNLMPHEYASADRWILQYLKGDETILKHIAPDGDDTAGLLFVRFLEEQLRKQGLSLTDIGLHRVQLKKPFFSWNDFPRPLYSTRANFIACLEREPSLFAKVLLEFSSHENPQKKISHLLRLADIGCRHIPLQFSVQDPNSQRLHVQLGEQEETFLGLDNTDRLIDLKLTYELPLGFHLSKTEQTLSIAKGTSIALCFHFGGSTPGLTSQYHEQFSLEKSEKKRLHALLAFVGASYFDRCGQVEEMLSLLHKINGTTAMAFGLVKLSPDTSRGPFQGDEDLVLPQVDMSWFRTQSPSFSVNHNQFQALMLATQSSYEHQILREIFNDENAVSTVKLLQLAHQQHQKKGLDGEGFLTLTQTALESVETTPEAAQSLYFPQLDNLNLRRIKEEPSGQWTAISHLLGPENPLSSWSYAYMTPGLISNPSGSYQELGTLIFHPEKQYALISNNNLVFHGGLGSPLPSYDLTPFAIQAWQLVPNTTHYTLQTPSSPSIPIAASPGTVRYTPDVRSEHKPFVSYVSDPVDVVTGAFYIDEVDLILPGPFPLTIRRNYNSQNPLIGDLGIGWKLSLNPYLIEQDGKLYAAEADGTILVYSHNPATFKWEVLPEDNPDLYHFHQNTNPFQAYIKDNVLYGSDGSKRVFEDGLLKTWINKRGNTLSFLYNHKKLTRIESSHGNFCGFHYNHEGQISEIYAKDGRRVSYSYNSQGDLVKVTLPNTAVIGYDYDYFHRIIRETKPHGKTLENIYHEGRVKEQRSPMGLRQAMITTATFDYQDNCTTVTDANGAKTVYKIFQKQIYKISDPLSFETLQSWFVNKTSYFDPLTEKIIEWREPGAAPRCLKSSTDKRGLTTSYLYDKQGNPINIKLKGQDLTGSGETATSKKFTYNDQNLCIQEETLSKKTVITYDKTLPYLPKKVETYHDNTLISFIDLEYNSSGQIEKEDHSGSITLWKYDSHGFPSQKIELTGTDDLDVITTYLYNLQGQCIEVKSADTIQQNDYDMMGNEIASKTFSPTGSLLSATYIDYDLNNQPISKQTATPHNTLDFDYHASGRIKALRQTVTQAIAYTLYEYDPAGYLIEEVDPLGYTTYRDYDALGRVNSETKEGHTIHFTYESGGLLETITSPSGAKTTRLYTTNGLLKEEIYPDETHTTFVYDLTGRPIRETKNGITWEITYDDSHHLVTRTNVATKISEIREYDPRGNLIRFTDAAGYTSEKTYDGLNRIKTETTPSGEQTAWSYQNDTIICTLPNGEKKIQRYEGGRVIAAEVIDAEGHRLESYSYQYDPETDTQTTTEGNETTIISRNPFGLPLQVQKGEIVTTYAYDFCGNCIAVTDGDGKTTHQTFDGQGRLTQKILPDGSRIGYTYDLDSNLTEYQLPNDLVWKASYDPMRRKISEELQAGVQTSLHWSYTYTNGYLTEAKDPLGRIHTYLYDQNGSLSHETVGNWERHFTYDPRGLLSSAEQIGTQNISWLSSWFYSPHPEHSKIERFYDSDGHLEQENIYLNSNLIQQTTQVFDTSNRSLLIDGHRRDFIYQNHRLIQVSTNHVDLFYTYDLSGSLSSQLSPWSTTTIEHNPSGLPEHIQRTLPDSSQQESLHWYPSGKLFSYSSPAQQKQFSYTARGYLQAAEQERYDFDFGAPGTGVRTLAPDRIVHELDPFGKTLTEIIDKNTLTTTYDVMGQVVSQGQKQLEWDPWGRLLKVSDPAFTWEASYDALGRRLQTRYTPSGASTFTTTSLYDPENEFQEIGIQYGNKTFWKIYGPTSCDALTEETGATVILHHNALDQLAAIVSSQGTLHTNQFPSSYGPQSNPSIPSDLLTYAQSLSWHSQSQDPTGLIWMGARYYDPKGGRFLSPDPVGYPLCLDLYVYAGGDPVNYMDPDGRFFSSTYQTLKSTVLSVWHNPCFQGGVQAFGGLSEAGFGAGMTFATGGVAASLGWPIMVHGLDHFVTGMRTAITGRYGETASVQLLQKTGLSHQTANLLDSGLSMGGAMGGAAIIRPAHSGVLLRLTEPQSLQTGVHITEDWAQLSGILKRASQGKGNFGLGAATREQSNAMGKAWVGEGYRISSDRTAWVSTDGMRQYRPPSIKGKLGKVQANFERKFEGQTWNSWPSNGHLDILD